MPNLMLTGQLQSAWKLRRQSQDTSLKLHVRATLDNWITTLEAAWASAEKWGDLKDVEDGGEDADKPASGAPQRRGDGKDESKDESADESVDEGEDESADGDKEMEDEVKHGSDDD
ncbi:hypothetical protein M427DRAFT_36865 [Gonapodya prolifera JEL478]|uniref:Uncharacterized protein n=1 Tax=Gonapodya prolifera (strain JEL478) TaxID=1344416 RepID=A0A139A1F7_GONPJ|nr:hypothetical protein M427DRAFT_36865 [Gonapodya prolifera JEL478]|eukprot:KXS10616.1 hypothetical protein M427DRAFT_36865 [Gonapodya prolifera JEL478]